MAITLFHGTLESTAVDILAKQEIRYSKGDKHYLGSGIYFYNDDKQALVWAIMKSNVVFIKTGIKERPMVIQASIDVYDEQFMDLDLRQDQDEFFYQRREYSKLIRQNKLNVKYYNDSQFCDFIRDRLSVKLMSKTFVYIHERDIDIPVLYSNIKSTNRNITRHFRTERQYCLKDSNWVVRYMLREFEGGEGSG